MDITIETQRIISYCTGTRGLERGLERVGLPMQTVAFLEIEAFVVANLVTQMEAGLLDPAPIWTNIKTFDAWQFRNKIHGIIGGYPCQPFSHAGERKGIEDERHLWPYIFKQVEIIRPQWVWFENVAGHLSLGYEEVRRSLSSLGYRVEEGIFTAEEVGAPHRRERLFIFGVMENASILRWRGRNIGDTGRNECEIQTEGSSSSLADSNCNDSRTEPGFLSTEKGKGISETHKREWSGDEFRSCDSTMADTTGEGQQITRPARERKLSEETGEGLDNRLEQCGNTVEHSDSGSKQHISGKDIETTEQRQFSNTSGQLDDTIKSGLEGHAGHDSREGGWEKQERSIAERSLFPAGQGKYQYEWEEPRTIKSSLEYTIDGYNFTEDLHRAIGNSVVEQVSEVAFISLLQKHLNHI